MHPVVPLLKKMPLIEPSWRLAFLGPVLVAVCVRLAYHAAPYDGAHRPFFRTIVGAPLDSLLNGAAAPVPAVRATFIYATSPRGGLDTTTENVTRILSEREFSEALQRGERFMDASPEAYGAYLTTWRKVLRAAPEGAVVSVANSGEHSSEPTGALEILHDRGRKFLPFIWPPRSVGEALTLDLGSNGNDASGTKGPMTLTCLQASPKAFYVQNFLSDQEAE